MESLFESKDGFAYCQRDQLAILPPRIQPGASPGEADVEYPLRLGSTRSSVSFGGRHTPATQGKPAQFELSLDPSTVVDHILKVRDKVGAKEGPVEYLKSFAEGLLLAQAGAAYLLNDTEYRVSVGRASLKGIDPAPHASGTSDAEDRLVLATLLVAAQPGGVAS